MQAGGLLIVAYLFRVLGYALFGTRSDGDRSPNLTKGPGRVQELVVFLLALCALLFALLPPIAFDLVGVGRTGVDAGAVAMAGAFDWDKPWDDLWPVVIIGLRVLGAVPWPTRRSAADAVPAGVSSTSPGTLRLLSLWCSSGPTAPCGSGPWRACRCWSLGWQAANSSRLDVVIGRVIPVELPYRPPGCCDPRLALLNERLSLGAVVAIEQWTRKMADAYHAYSRVLNEIRRLATGVDLIGLRDSAARLQAPAPDADPGRN